jgi:hypothetical protein
LIIVLTVAALLWSVSMSRRSVAFAFAINWALMGFAYVVWLVVPIRLGRGYYRVRSVEHDGRLYELLGVRLFQRILRLLKLHGRRPFPGYVRGPTGGASLVATTLGPETAHLLIFAVVSGVAVDATLRGWWNTAGWLMLFNIVLNLYPVLSLRFVRARAERLFGPSDAVRYVAPRVPRSVGAAQQAAADAER